MKRESIKTAKRIVIKIGSSSLTHRETKDINYRKLEQLARVLSDLKNQGKEIVLVTSGAQAVGRKVLSLSHIPEELAKKQALAAIGQAKLMTSYQRLFLEYHQNVAQILLTKYTFTNKLSFTNAKNTFTELLDMGIIPIVNENDTVATDEIEFGDNDHLSAYIVGLLKADALIILSDIEGFYTDDPSINKNATLIDYVSKIEEDHFLMSKSTTSSGVGTGGMLAKIDAARIATEAGADMVLMNGHDVTKLYDVLEGKNVGTFFKSNKKEDYDVKNYL